MKISRYSILPLTYLALNVKIVSLGESFPITFATFSLFFLIFYIDKINIKKLTFSIISLTALVILNKVFGRSLDPQKYVTSLMLFIYVGLLFSLVYSCSMRKITNINKLIKSLKVVVIIVVTISILEVGELIIFRSSRLISLFSKMLIYSNDYLINFVQYGALRSNSLYFEPAFYSLALLSMWLCLRQLNVKSMPMNVLVFTGILCSGSFSGLMTFIIFLIVDDLIKVSKDKNSKKKIKYLIASLSIMLVISYFLLPYILNRISELGVIGTSSYYRIVGPLKIIYYTLTNIDGMIQFGSLYNLVSSFQLMNGAQVGRTLDNGIYVLIVHFSWLAMLMIIVYMVYLLRAIIKNLRDNSNQDSSLVLLLIFIPLSLFFTGAIFSPEYAYTIAAPFLMRKLKPQS